MTAAQTPTAAWPMLTVIDDYTVLEIGTVIAGWGRVERCPRCGRNGLRERLEGHEAILHTETSELMSDGLLVVPGDCCTNGIAPDPAGRAGS
jgi:hypothetical protein